MYVPQRSFSAAHSLAAGIEFAGLSSRFSAIDHTVAYHPLASVHA